MILIDWAQLCEMAFLDDSDRLCMIGVMTRFPAPALPIRLRHVMIVVRIVGGQAEKTFDIGISMVTPNGSSLTPQQADAFDIAVTAEYVFITLRDIPLKEEGTHRFAVSVGSGDPVFLDVPVLLVKNQAHSSRKRDNAPTAAGQPAWLSGREVN